MYNTSFYTYRCDNTVNIEYTMILQPMRDGELKMKEKVRVTYKCS